MRTLNGIIMFSGGEFTIHSYETGDETFTIGDVAVSAAIEPKSAERVLVTVKLPGLTVDPAYDVTINDDGSVTLAGWFPAEEGDGGEGGEGAS